MTSALTIAEVARRSGLTAHTLRYYERVGLISPVSRAPGGQRRYAASDLDWIEFLKRLREARMTIAQMRAFSKLRLQGNATASQRRAMLEQHLAQLLESIMTMKRAAKALGAKIEHYRILERSLRRSASVTERRAS